MTGGVTDHMTGGVTDHMTGGVTDHMTGGVTEAIYRNRRYHIYNFTYTGWCATRFNSGTNIIYYICK